MRPNPQTPPPTPRGAGLTTEKPDATLTYADGRPPVTKAKEVTAAVIDIIGLDYNQFSQIAMIAQGQFTKLLNASTDERSRIFRKLFRTQPYQRLQERLQAENAALTRQREEQSVRIGQLLSGLSWAEGDADGAVLDGLAPLCEAGGQASPEGVLPLLDALLAGQEQALSAAAAARTEAEAELDKLQQTLGRAEQAEKLRLELTAAQANTLVSALRRDYEAGHASNASLFEDTLYSGSFYVELELWYSIRVDEKPTRQPIDTTSNSSGSVCAIVTPEMTCTLEALAGMGIETPAAARGF